MGLQTIFKTKKLLERSQPGNGALLIYDFGELGVSTYIPIIKSPQVAVLSIGGKREKLVMEPDLKIEFTSLISLSFDGRCIDFEIASKFLQSLVNYLESPKQLLL